MKALTTILALAMLSTATDGKADDTVATGPLGLTAFPENLPKQIPCHLLPGTKYSSSGVSVRYEYPEPLRNHSLWQEGVGVNDKIYVYDAVDERTFEASPGVYKKLNQRCS